jgi:O-antigen/teichoic acid export membrane protein
MSESQSSYRQIFKATSLFGGVQVIIIIIGIIKTKFIAIWLSTTGVGIMGLLTAPLSLISALSGLGLSISAVREISEAAGSGDQLYIAKTVKIFRRWVWFTGILGMGLTVVLAPMLSKWSFGNSNYIPAFLILSLTLLLTEITVGQKAILQGMRRLKHMAKATIIGTVVSLFTSLPLYYLYGIHGIVPSLLIAPLSSLIAYWYYSRKITLLKVHINYKDSFKGGLPMVKLGIVLAFSGLIGTLIRYIITAYISKKGGVEQVGLYQAGFTLITGYIGIVFTAMATDYFPRLASTKDNKECINLINQQIEMALLIVAPICIALMIALPVVIKLLYSSAFLGTIPMVEWVLISVTLKAIAWSIGFLFLAKADYSTSFKIDNITNILFLSGYVVMYSIMGLQGLGIAEFILYLLGMLLTFYYARKKYDFIFHKNTTEIIFLTFAISLSVFLVLKLMGRNLSSYIISIILLILTSYLSFKSLDKKLDLKSIIRKYIKKYNYGS